MASECCLNRTQCDYLHSAASEKKHTRQSHYLGKNLHQSLCQIFMLFTCLILQPKNSELCQVKGQMYLNSLFKAVVDESSSRLKTKHWYNVALSTLAVLVSCSCPDCDPLWLQNIRTRTLQGVGFGLSFGRLPGSLCYKYMLVDGDKVMFGSYR